jgi:hypothetical protein
MTVSSRCIALGLGTSVPVALLFLLSIGLYGHVWIPTDEPGTRPRADLMTLYAASKLAIESPEGMYDQARQGAMQAEVTGLPISGDDPDFLPFAYPAATALALAPLTLLDYVTAYWVLAALNVLALGILVCLLGSRLGLGAEASQVLALSATLCVGVYATLVQGQLSIFVALALSMAVLDLREGREIRAGMWAGLLSLKPVVLPGLLVWLVMRRRWTALVATGSVSALFALVSIGWTGIEGFTAYRALSARMLDDSFYTAQGIQTSNLRGLAHYLGTGDIGKAMGRRPPAPGPAAPFGPHENAGHRAVDPRRRHRLHPAAHDAVEPALDRARLLLRGLGAHDPSRARTARRPGRAGAVDGALESVQRFEASRLEVLDPSGSGNPLFELSCASF